MISLDERAATEVQQALAQKGVSSFGLRVQVIGGGCEGFVYDLAFAEAAEEQEMTFDSHGIAIFVDRRTLPAVEGLVIGYRYDPPGPGFVFTNPRARSKCSCGASFAA